MGKEQRGREGEGKPRGGEGTRPHPFTPPIHISGYAPAMNGPEADWTANGPPGNCMQRTATA